MISTIAKTYAKALEGIRLEDLQNVSEIINDELTSTMLNPVIDNSTKYQIIDEVLKDNFDEKIKNFLKILIDKNRFSILNEIVDAFQEQYDSDNNIKRVQVISAIELSSQQKNSIIQKLEERLSKKVIPKWTVNEDIIAGLVIKIDDEVIDSSIKTKLKKVSRI